MWFTMWHRIFDFGALFSKIRKKRTTKFPSQKLTALVNTIILKHSCQGIVWPGWWPYKRTQTAVKTKTLVTNLTSNETDIAICIFWNLTYSFASIDSLVKSETYKRRSYFFLIQNFKKNFKSSLWSCSKWFFAIVLLMGNWKWK